MNEVDAKKPDAGESGRGYHRLSTYAKCPRKYAFRYLLRLEPLFVGKALATGSVIHIGLMNFFLSMMGAKEAMDPVEAMRRSPARIAWCFERARAAFSRWVNWYQDIGHRYLGEPVSVEQEWELPLGANRFTSRLDLVFRRQGKIYICDHKSAGGNLQNNHLNYEMSGQMAMQHALGEAIVAPTFGNVFGGNIIHSVGTANQPEIACVTPIHIGELWRRSVVDSILETSDEVAWIEENWDGDAWSLPVRPEACRGRFGRCEFTPLCTRGQSALVDYQPLVDEATEE